MKKTTLILAAVFALGASLRADEPKSSYSVTSDFSYASEYVFRGIKYANNSFTPSVEVSSNGGYLGLWTNQPVTKGQQDEIDIYGGYKYKVSDALSVEGVLTHYWYPEFKLSNPRNVDRVRDSNEAGVGATYTIGGFSPSLYYYYDLALKSQTLQASLGYSIPVSHLGFSVDTSVFAGTVASRNWTAGIVSGTHESYNYYGVDVSVPYKLSDTSTVRAGVHYAGNDQLGAGMGSPRNNLWFTLGLTTGF